MAVPSKEVSKQRGLKYTEHKPFGRHYLGVTHTTMSSAVKTRDTEAGGPIRLSAQLAGRWGQII
jgi:hypothetical protein